MSHPGRLIVGHPYNPVYLLPVVEVVGGEHTTTETLELAVEMVDEADAKSATSLAKPQLAAASLVAQKDGLGTVVSRIEVAAESRWVVLSLTLDKAELGEILARVQRTVDRSPPPEQNPPSQKLPAERDQE